MTPRSLLLIAFAASALSAAEPLPPGVTFLQERLRKDPDDFIAQAQLAERCLTELHNTGQMKWLPLAEAASVQAMRGITPENNPGGVLAQGRVALAAHRFVAARDAAQLFRKLRPEKPAGRYLLFDAQFELGDYKAAEAALNELEHFEPGSIAVHSRRARLASIRGQDTAAPTAALLEAARKLSPVQPGMIAWALVQVGERAFRIGDFDAAEKAYAEATSLAPADWRVQSHLAELRGAEGRFDESLVLLEKAIASTGRPELMQAAGDLEVARGKPDAAKPWHDRALGAYLASIERGELLYVHHLAGFYCDSRPQPAEAVKFARKDLADRASIHAHAALAWALHLDNQLEAAAAQSTLALATGTKDAHILYQAGLIFTAAGDLPRGRAAMRAATEANPRRASFHFHR